MKIPEVRARIDKAMAERSKRTGINADRVLRELGKIAFVNATDVIDMSDATVKNDAERDDTAAIASVKVKVIPGENGDGVERGNQAGRQTESLGTVRQTSRHVQGRSGQQRPPDGGDQL